MAFLILEQLDRISNNVFHPLIFALIINSLYERNRQLLHVVKVQYC
jgi:hypothetical protein